MNTAIATVVLGGFGALAAIFLKEAVQLALQRRVITWQLFGHLLHWKGQVINANHGVSLYNVVQKRESEIRISYSKGTEAFNEQWLQHRTKKDEAKAKIKEEVMKVFKEKDGEGSIFNAQGLMALETTAAFASQQRTYLMDSKTFISDRDAAMLGKSFAMNVVQFRSSLCNLLAIVESLSKVPSFEGAEGAKAVESLVDQFITAGDDFLIALIRLERGVKVLLDKPLLALTLDVLAGR